MPYTMNLAAFLPFRAISDSLTRQYVLSASSLTWCMPVRCSPEVVILGETFASPGERIKMLRQHKHLTQEQLGELAGLNPNYIGQLERGQRTPSIQTIHALAEALQVDPGFLLLSPEKSDATYNHLMAIVALATPEQVALITKIAETVVSSGYRVGNESGRAASEIGEVNEGQYKGVEDEASRG